METVKRISLSFAFVIVLSSLILLAPAVHADPSHQVVARSTPSNNFATMDQGCLGPLRSQIAQGQFNGVGPFGEHFNGTVDPGAHYGTAGEANFLTSILGVQDLTSFCASSTQ